VQAGRVLKAARPGGRRKRTRRPYLWASERMVRGMGYTVVAGLDEVGLGPLAGPAVAAACVLPIGARLPGLDDSKKLTAEQRRRLDRQIRRVAVAFAVAEVPAEDVDSRGLTYARQRAMEMAVRALSPEAQYLLIDAWDVPELPLPQMAVIRGDGVCASIMAASIIAKVHRDTLMIEYDAVYPGYGFALHKGYATAAHRAALMRLGPSPIHRMSWRPVRKALGLAGGVDPAAELPAGVPVDA
jgi:ribonuclease HII